MSDQNTRIPSLLLRGARLVTSEGITEGASLLLEGGLISRLSASNAGRTSETDRVEADRVVDLGGLTLFPGFIDVHIHGALGVDMMEAEPEDLQQVARFLASSGVTSWLPTLVPAPDEDYRRAARAVGQLMSEQERRPEAGARALGLHYEGPFINSAQCGALRTQFFRTYSEPQDLEFLAAVDVNGRSAVHMMTLAPETVGGISLVSELTRRGWVCSIGHTRAALDVLDDALRAGARHMTHFLNAMSPLHHRQPGPIGWGLVRDDVSCDVIADGVHSDTLMLQLVLRCKGAQRVTLISDAVAPTGMGDGEFRVWGETITVVDGRTSNERGSIAGSVITLNDAVRMMSKLGFAPEEIARMASTNPARLLGLEKSCGSIEEGKRADLTVLDAEGRVRFTLVGGRAAFEDLG